MVQSNDVGRPEDQDLEQSAGHYFAVNATWGTWVVSTVMARFIEQCLAEVPPPRWVTFVELSGARVRLRARDIRWIAESSPEQRAFDRAHGRRLRRERRAERDYDDDEDDE